MRIKKHRNKNHYLMTPEGMWVRDFTRTLVPYEDINKTISEQDHFLFLKNEFQNSKSKIPWIDSENFFFRKVAIISNGYHFNDKQDLIEKLPTDVTLIGVNGSLAKWRSKRSLNFYVVNNPYEECMYYLPKTKNHWPKCVLSTRTNHDFTANYKGVKYRYAPTPESSYAGPVKGAEYMIDDCRNPICASISLAYHWGAEKLLLLCCDDSFSRDRPGSEKLENGLWQYPQQRIAHGLIDGSLYWTKKKGIETKDHSCGLIYSNASYIEEDDIMSFFKE